MDIVFWLVFFIFVLVSFAIVGIVLMQEAKQGGLGEGLSGGGMQDFSSTRGGTAGGLQRLTIYLGVVWGLLALALALIPRA